MSKFVEIFLGFRHFCYNFILLIDVAVVLKKIFLYSISLLLYSSKFKILHLLSLKTAAHKVNDVLVIGCEWVDVRESRGGGTVSILGHHLLHLVGRRSRE